eukprot:jgi/Botrbrau1/22599/Bobra.176_1s0029.1
MSDAFLWQLVKNHNAFLYKGLQQDFFSAEPGNVANKHSFKYSGLANVKTVDISAGEEGAISVTTPRLKNTKKPAVSKHTALVTKQTRKALKGIGKQVSHIRPDLVRPALARASEISKATRAAKGKQGK